MEIPLVKKNLLNTGSSVEISMPRVEHGNRPQQVSFSAASPSAGYPSMNLILASSSVYRQALLRRLRLPFTSESPDIDESPGPGELPAALACRLSRQKAAKVAGRNPDAYVIGSDQVASLDGQILGKPGTVESAVAQLCQCRGRQVIFETGLCLWSPDASWQLSSVSTRVRFRDLDERLLRRYVELEMPLDCAGSFKCESLGIVLFEQLQSDDPTALEGLPLIELASMLRRAGIEPLVV
jgi:septum formation protein